MSGLAPRASLQRTQPVFRFVHDLAVSRTAAPGERRPPPCVSGGPFLWASRNTASRRGSTNC